LRDLQINFKEKIPFMDERRSNLAGEIFFSSILERRIIIEGKRVKFLANLELQIGGAMKKHPILLSLLKL
jgi:hypothetical protein